MVSAIREEKSNRLRVVRGLRRLWMVYGWRMERWVAPRPVIAQGSAWLDDRW